jgi:transcriptional regulator with XRE-family HTH domain
MSRRSNKIELSREGQVLKGLREEHKLTMKQVAAKTGLSDTMISFLENGRVALPKSNDTLEKLLKVYGDISKKYFFEKVRNYNEDDNDLHYLRKVLPRLSKSDLKIVRQIVDMHLRKEK